jgi:hypothetical protein
VTGCRLVDQESIIVAVADHRRDNSRAGRRPRDRVRLGQMALRGWPPRSVAEVRLEDRRSAVESGCVVALLSASDAIDEDGDRHEIEPARR